MDSKSIHAKMFIQSKHHVERVKLPKGFAGMARYGSMTCLSISVIITVSVIVGISL